MPSGLGSIGSARVPRLDPRARALLSWLDLVGAPRLHTRSVPEARRDFRVTIAATSRVEAVAEVSSITVPGPAGPLAARVYVPRDAGALPPILVWFHGGGFVIGDLATADPTCRVLANRSRAIVVSVEYRLAPENQVPAAVEDCIAATAWVAENAASLGGDGSRLAVGGDSAGGTLAALVALAARERGPDIAAQLLVYPATDLTLTHPSVREFGRAPFLLDLRALDWFVGHYLDGAEARDPAISPLHAPDLAGAAPAILLLAEFDPVHDEAQAYADRLRAAGVTTEVIRFDGQIHGFFTMDLVFPAARDAQDRAGRALAERLAVTEPPFTRPPAAWVNGATLARVSGATAASAAILAQHHAGQLWDQVRLLAGMPSGAPGVNPKENPNGR